MLHLLGRNIETTFIWKYPVFSYSSECNPGLIALRDEDRRSSHDQSVVPYDESSALVQIKMMFSFNAT